VEPWSWIGSLAARASCTPLPPSGKEAREPCSDIFGMLHDRCEEVKAVKAGAETEPSLERECEFHRGFDPESMDPQRARQRGAVRACGGRGLLASQSAVFGSCGS
jgi:hypothetical protein